MRYICNTLSMFPAFVRLVLGIAAVILSPIKSKAKKRLKKIRKGLAAPLLYAGMQLADLISEICGRVHKADGGACQVFKN